MFIIMSIKLLPVVVINMLLLPSVAFKTHRLLPAYNLKHFIRISTAVNAERISGDGVSLDASLLSENPELVVSHLQSRRASKDLIGEVNKVSDLRIERSKMIAEGDQARNKRKSLSKDIGMLMREGKDASDLKRLVEDANNVAAAADAKLSIIDEEINNILSVIPNLVDDR